MEDRNIEKIIIKFLDNEANVHELDTLEAWTKNKGNFSVFKDFIKIYFLTVASMGKYDINDAKKSIKQKIRKNRQTTRFKVYKNVAYAASLCFLLATSIFFIANNSNTAPLKSKESSIIEAGSYKAILTLENGDQITLAKGKDYDRHGVHSNGEQLIYKKKSAGTDVSDKMSFNYLTIPRGGEFFVQLIDGTKIWLNSDSKLKYPVKFDFEQPREVNLLYGEAYFEVSPSSKHNDALFRVFSKSQKIDVLGTKFNVKAYDGESAILTTLVEGEVKIKKGNESRLLYPNQQALVNTSTDSIRVSEVDASDEVSWVQGLFSFNEKSLEEIMRILARWYNVEVHFDIEERKDFIFTGILDRTDNIDDILGLIESASNNEVKFQIDSNVITIK